MPGIQGEPLNMAELQEQNRALVEKLMGAHMAIAASWDGNVAGSGVPGYPMPIYDNSQRMVIAAIRYVYGMTRLKAMRVYCFTIDNGESVRYNVDLVREGELP